jgi:hypothetical protein
MNRKRNILRLAVAAVVAGCALHWWPDNDPVYEGRRTSVWVAQAFEDPLRRDAMEAVKEIGAPAVPFIAKRLHDRSHTLTFLSAEKVWAFRYRHPRLDGWMAEHVDNCAGKHDRAGWLLRLIGTNAQAAIPDVIDCLENCPSLHSYPATQLLDTLGDISGTNLAAIPYLTRRAGGNDSLSLRAAAVAYNIDGKTNLIIKTCERLSREDPGCLLGSEELGWYRDDRELNRHLVPLLERLYLDRNLDSRERESAICALQSRTNDAAAMLFCAVTMRNRENPMTGIWRSHVLSRPSVRGK